MAARGWRRFLPARHLPLHALTLSLLALAWMFDEPIAKAMDAWYNGSGSLNGELHQLILSLAQYAQPLGYLTAGALILTFDPRRRGRVAVLALVLITVGGASTALKSLVGRERPRDSACETIFHGPARNLVDTKTASFPSGHTATAFALSVVLSSLYPRTRWFVWPMATGVAINRVVTVRHFPSDVVAGAWLGYVLAESLMQSEVLWRWSERIARAAASLSLRLPAPRWSPQGMRAALASPVLLAVVCLSMYWAGNGEYSLWDRDEPRFATASREMLARGDWIVPSFNGDLRPDKPILIYWLQRVAFLILGDGPFAARFWSGVGGTVACLMTWRLGAAMFSPRVGLVAAWVLALSPMLIVESKLGTVDAVLLASLMIALDALWRLIQGDRKLRTALIFWLALALGILTKGPVAILLPVAAGGGYALLSGRFGWLRSLRWGWGLALTALLIAPWVVAVQVATEGEFLRRALGHHVITRALKPLENHSGFPGYYVVSVLALMAPWSLLLPWAFWHHRSRWRSDPRFCFLAGWIVITLVTFEFVRTKLVHYYLPAYPALALVLASALVGKFAGAPIGLRRLPRPWLAWGMISLGLAYVVVTAVLSHTYLREPIGVPLSVMTGMGGVGFALAGRMVADGRFRLAFRTQLAAGCLTVLLAGVQVLPAVHSSQVVVQVADRLRACHETGDPIALWRYRDPSLIYNTRQIVPMLDSGQDSAPFVESREFAEQKGHYLCPMTDDELAAFSQDGELHLSVRETISSWDVGELGLKSIHLVEVQPRRIAVRQQGHRQ